jgi:hypothetical protein
LAKADFFHYLGKFIVFFFLSLLLLLLILMFLGRLAKLLLQQVYFSGLLLKDAVKFRKILDAGDC